MSGKENRHPKVSIIVPIYNAQSTISSLIESVQSQEEQSWELLLVNDGSIDESGLICDEASKADARIITIHQKNQGVSAARNAGLDHATAEWITFVDSDDMLTDTFLSSMLNAAESGQNVDLVYGSYAIVEGGKTSISLYNNMLYTESGGVRNALLSTKIMHRCSPWAKLFKRSIIEANHLRFDMKLPISEDRLFVYGYFPYVKCIATTATVGYIYGSFSATSLKHKKHHESVLVHRQKVMTEALKKVYAAFSINPSEEYVMWNHLMRILVETMECVYIHHGCCKRTENLQNKILLDCFPKDLGQQALQNASWKRMFDSNVMLQFLVAGKFSKFNRKLWLRDTNLAVRRFAHRLLKKKSIQGSFNSAISYINKVK